MNSKTAAPWGPMDETEEKVNKYSHELIANNSNCTAHLSIAGNAVVLPEMTRKVALDHSANGFLSNLRKDGPLPAEDVAGATARVRQQVARMLAALVPGHQPAGAVF